MYKVVKYITFQEGGLKQILVFPETVKHSKFRYMNPETAGFIKFKVKLIDGFNEVSCECHGRSDSLGVKSNPVEDSKLAAYHFNMVYAG